MGKRNVVIGEERAKRLGGREVGMFSRGWGGDKVEWGLGRGEEGGWAGGGLWWWRGMDCLDKLCGVGWCWMVLDQVE